MWVFGLGGALRFQKQIAIFRCHILFMILQLLSQCTVIRRFILYQTSHRIRKVIISLDGAVEGPQAGRGVLSWSIEAAGTAESCGLLALIFLVLASHAVLKQLFFDAKTCSSLLEHGCLIVADSVVAAVA